MEQRAVPADLGERVEIPVNVGLGRDVALVAVLCGLPLLLLPMPDRPALIDLAGAALFLVGLVFLVGASLKYRHGPQTLILDADTLTVPTLPWIGPPRVVRWREVASVGQVWLPNNLGPAMSIRCADGTLANLPLASLPAERRDELLARIAVRARCAADGEPAELLAGWEAIALVGGAAVLHGARLIDLVPDVGAYAERRADFPPGHHLVLGRPPPAAAVGVDPGTLDRLLELVAAHAPPGELDRRNLVLFGEAGIYELFSVLRRLAISAPAEREAVAADHFARLTRLAEQSEALLALAEDLDSVRSRLRIELDHTSRSAAQVVARPLGADVLALLTLDHEDGTTPVPRHLASRWGVSDDALFAQATENLRSRPGPEATERGTHTLRVGDDTTSAQLLTDVPDGAVVAVPARNALLVMDSVRSLLVGGAMLREATELHRSAARPVAPGLFVWWGGVLHPVQVVAGPEGMPTFVPPGDVFSEILAGSR